MDTRVEEHPGEQLGQGARGGQFGIEVILLDGLLAGADRTGEKQGEGGPYQISFHYLLIYILY
jgi:hypothetical protein